MRKTYKRALAAFLSLLIVFSVFSVYAEKYAWDCPDCERKGNTGNYCGGCGHPAPWIESAAAASEDMDNADNDAAASPETDFEYKIEDGKAVITKYTGPGGDVVIPKAIDGYNVTSIGDKAFYECSGLTGMTIPDSVTSIGDYSFYKCDHMTSVNIPGSATSIGRYAFYGCGSLTSVTVPASVTSIGADAFRLCGKNLVIHVSKGSYALDYCKSHGLKYQLSSSEAAEMTEPAETASPQQYFKRDIKDGKATITKYTGPGGDVVIPNKLYGYNVVSIGAQAFSGCSSVTSVTIPDGVTSIGENAFYKCSRLASVTLPKSVESIGTAVFKDCSKKLVINVPKGSYALNFCKLHKLKYKIQ